MAFRSQLVKRLGAISILVVFFAWTGWYIFKNHQNFREILHVPLFNLVTLYLIFATSLYLAGAYTRYVTQAFGLQLGRIDCFMLAAATSAANYMAFFRAGAGVRAVYLKTRHRFAYSDFISTLAAMYLMHFIINGFIGLIGLFILVNQGLPFSLPFAVFFAVSALFSAVIILCGITLPQYERFPFREIARVINGWALIRNNPALLAKLSANTLFYYVAFALQTKMAFSTYGVHLNWGALLFYTSGRIPVSFATITPGAIGILEGFTVYMGRVFDYTAAEALQVQGLIRFVAITSLLLLGPWAFSRMGNKSIKQLDKAGQPHD